MICAESQCEFVLEAIRFLYLSAIVAANITVFVVAVLVLVVLIFERNALFSIRFFVFVVFISSVGFAGCVVGIVSAMSRASGNAALITASLSLIGTVGAIFMKDIQTSKVVIVAFLSIALTANILGGVVVGARLRDQATESLEAKIKDEIEQFRVFNFRRNLGIYPLK